MSRRTHEQFVAVYARRVYRIVARAMAREVIRGIPMPRETPEGLAKAARLFGVIAEVVREHRGKARRRK